MGDCYIAVGGLVQRDSDGFQVLIEQRTLEEAAQDAAAVVGFAKEMLMRARNPCCPWSPFVQVHMPHNGQQVTLRIGIHSGKLVSGMLGTRLPKFTLFGDTMNTASRMESTAPPGCIQVSEATHQLLMYAKSMGFASSQLFDEASSHSSNSGEHSLQHGRGSSMAAPMPGVWVETGGVEVKGKGCMDTFVWMPSDHPLRLNGLPTTQT
ncbi:nucleotide cyclase, partial [Haematococcus lacustris]